MAIKVIRRYKFTCTAISYRAPGKGLFVKGQVVTVNEDDPKLSFFREGGFKEEPLPPIEVDDGQSAADAAPKGDDPPGDGDDDDPVTPETPLAEIAGIRGNVAESLAEKGIVTVANALAVGLDALVEVPGIGEKTAQSIMDICNAVVGGE